MRNFLFFIAAHLLFIFFSLSCQAQELRANVTVASNKISTAVDKRVFQTMQNAIAAFLNNRVWTNDQFTNTERIECNFLLNITEVVEDNTYKASLTVQSVRPVYNASYTTTLLNILDENVLFRYVEFQPLEFNDNRVVGNDPLAANLTAVLAYYAYIIIGLDYDSFSLRGGDAYFKKALNIVNNAPEGRNVTGWKSFEGTRNRYWLQDNLLNARLSIFHDAMYQYHRLGLDVLYDDMNKGRASILNALNLLNNLFSENSNTMILPTFFTAKSDELIRLFAKAPPQERIRAGQLLAQMDIPNASKYQQQLK